MVKKQKISPDSEIIETPGVGKLNGRDLLIGLLIAVATPIVMSLYDVLMAFLEYQPVDIQWRSLIKPGVAAGAAYLVKNLFDKSKFIIHKKR